VTATIAPTPTPVPASLKLSSSKLVGKNLKFPNEPFGGQGKTSPPVFVSVKNPGGAKGVEVQLENIGVTGSFAIDSGNTSCPNPGTLPPGGTPCKIALTFTPTGFGLNQGTLTLTDNAKNNPQVLTLKGKGIPGVLKVAPKTLAFGKVPVSTPSAPKQVVLTNNSGVPFEIDAISSSDPQFAPDQTCVGTLGTGTTCTINVTFTPASKGSKTAKLLINDDAAGSPQKVTMTGSGS
jgi:hypothetical protein